MIEKKTEIGKKIWTIAIAFSLLGIVSFTTLLGNIPQVDAYSNSYDDSYFYWEDFFDNARYIDANHSENYVIESGYAQMYGTYAQWVNPNWTQMKQIILQSDTALESCAVKLKVEYDDDMQFDYDDLRFSYNNESIWLSYWVEERNPEPNNPYCVLWVKIPLLKQGDSTINMFYGNELAETMSDYFSVFDENSWNKAYVHDHQTTYHWEGEGAWDPDICWGNNRFLITWEEGTPYYLFPPMVFQQQIRGCFYDEEGNMIGNRFDITLEETSPYRYENPAACSNDDVFFVVYERYTNPINNNYLDRDLYGAIITHNGAVSRFPICTETGIQADPRVAYDDDNNRFFVVWEDGREGSQNYNIYGRLYDSSGTPVGDEKIISSRPNSQCEPWVSFDSVNNHFFVVWEEGIDPEIGPFEIWGQLFDVTGSQLGSAQRLSLQGEATKDYNFPCVSYCSLTERFFVTWQEDDISSNDWFGNIYGVLINEDGEILEDIFEIARGEFERSIVVPYLTSSFFVIYDDGSDIWGQLVSSQGDVRDYILQLSDGESDPADWCHVGSNGNQLLVSWEDTRIEYPPPYEAINLPDIFTNVWSFNTPSGSDISSVFGEEKSLILDATLTSIPIDPVNLQRWHEFYVEKTGDITFDILDGDSLDVLKSSVSSGVSLQSVSAKSIRLCARFHRVNPASSPRLDKWNVSYVGKDETPPKTTVDTIDGVKGLHEWYTSESVTIWLHAEDFPIDTGIGVDETLYRLNNGATLPYNEITGIHLTVSQATNWYGIWEITFWSVDRAGNHEDDSQPENTITIQIDAEQPYVEITTPADEERVDIPFWVRADAQDNVEIEKVEFDIEPFGEREGLPYVDDTPPYEWYCDVEQGDTIKQLLDASSIGVNVMVRARAYDKAGQTWNQEVWVHINNWQQGNGFSDSLCFIVSIGGQLQSVLLSNSLYNNYELTKGIAFGQVQWMYENGVCFSLGSNGVHSSIGSHMGMAEYFIGYANKQQNILVGLAGSISIQ